MITAGRQHKRQCKLCTYAWGCTDNMQTLWDTRSLFLEPTSSLGFGLFKVKKYAIYSPIPELKALSLIRILRITSD